MKSLAVTLALLLIGAPAAAQWLRYPTSGIPRTSEGRPDLSAPVPRTPEGKPVLSGLWRPLGRTVFDITSGMKPGEVVPYQPWAEALFNERRANDTRDDPTANKYFQLVPDAAPPGRPVGRAGN